MAFTLLSEINEPTRSTTLSRSYHPHVPPPLRSFPLAVTKLTAVVFPPSSSPPPHIEGTPQQCQSSGQRRSLRTIRTLFLAHGQDSHGRHSYLSAKRFPRHWATSTILQRYINSVQAYTSGKDNPTSGVNRRRQRVTNVGRQEAERGGRQSTCANSATSADANGSANGAAGSPAPKQVDHGKSPIQGVSSSFYSVD
ncbi:hypothetical protein B0H13DRAFT_2385108 [Mycena leptocephala]|nr:hypothetical protein B0H13DRAFT_2385108 [Mycena leptocephala]